MNLNDLAELVTKADLYETEQEKLLSEAASSGALKGLIDDLKDLGDNPMQDELKKVKAIQAKMSGMGLGSVAAMVGKNKIDAAISAVRSKLGSGGATTDDDHLNDFKKKESLDVVVGALGIASAAGLAAIINDLHGEKLKPTLEVLGNDAKKVAAWLGVNVQKLAVMSKDAIVEKLTQFKDAAIEREKHSTARKKADQSWPEYNKENGTNYKGFPGMSKSKKESSGGDMSFTDELQEFLSTEKQSTKNIKQEGAHAVLAAYAQENGSDGMNTLAASAYGLEFDTDKAMWSVHGPDGVVLPKFDSVTREGANSALNAWLSQSQQDMEMSGDEDKQGMAWKSDTGMRTVSAQTVMGDETQDMAPPKIWGMKEAKDPRCFGMGRQYEHEKLAESMSDLVAWAKDVMSSAQAGAVWTAKKIWSSLKGKLGNGASPADVKKAAEMIKSKGGKVDLSDFDELNKNAQSVKESDFRCSNGNQVTSSKVTYQRSKFSESFGEEIGLDYLTQEGKPPWLKGKDEKDDEDESEEEDDSEDEDDEDDEDSAASEKGKDKKKGKMKESAVIMRQNRQSSVFGALGVNDQMQKLIDTSRYQGPNLGLPEQRFDFANKNVPEPGEDADWATKAFGRVQHNRARR